VTADRLRGAIRSGDTAAQLGGDEFAIVLPGVDADGAMRIAGAMRAALLEALPRIGGLIIHVGTSVSIALCLADGTASPALLRRVDGTMYVAKQRRLGYAFYDPALDQPSPQRL